MKSFMMRISLMAGVILVALAGCHRYEAPNEKPICVTPDITLAALSDMLGDRPIVIDQKMVVGGYITSTDEESNFHKTLIIDDGTAAAEVMVGLYDTYRLYPMDHYLAVLLEGCALGRHYGVMQIGLPAKEYSSFPTDYFASRVILDRHLTLCDESRRVEPRPMAIGDLTEAMCGSLVRIDGLRLASNMFPDAWKVNQEGKWSGYNFFCDAAGNVIVVYTSEYADYGDALVPEGELSLTGIVQYGSVAGEKYFMIKMRYESDCVPGI
ncbi:MAG: hypothetical protein IIV58_02990 [Alistipes sp.]|nr:hypothetical protein [Alistipes sp.]